MKELLLGLDYTTSEPAPRAAERGGKLLRDIPEEILVAELKRRGYTVSRTQPADDREYFSNPEDPVCEADWASLMNNPAFR